MEAVAADTRASKAVMANSLVGTVSSKVVTGVSKDMDSKATVRSSSATPQPRIKLTICSQGTAAAATTGAELLAVDMAASKVRVAYLHTIDSPLTPSRPGRLQPRWRIWRWPTAGWWPVVEVDSIYTQDRAVCEQSGRHRL
jgi:hypothetical protein